MSGDTVAWVESGLQLINAIEAAAVEPEGATIVPRAGVAQLDDSVRALAPHLPPRVSLAAPRRFAFASPFASARTRIVGDAFSGQIRLTPGTPSTHYVLVDDGSAAPTAMSQIAGGAPLQRPGQREGLVSRVAGRAASRRLARAARGGRLTVVTSYEATVEARSLAGIGAVVQPNDYSWIRSVRLSDDPLAGARTVVVGAALAFDGYIAREAYRSWVLDSAGPDAVYVPHRREDPAFTAGLRESGVTVARLDVPIEVAVAAAGGVERVVTLPSSVVASLAVVAPHVALGVTRVAPEWWTPQADEGFRTLVDGIDREADSGR